MQALLLDPSESSSVPLRTPLPPFDPATFARESESLLSTASSSETVPPPPLYPSLLRGTPCGAPTECVSVTLQSCLRDSAHRASLLASTLRMGALSREEAARALRLELEGLEIAADGSRADSVKEIIAGLRDVIEELGGIAGESPAPPREVVVLDASRETASFLALALESHGHRVRLAASVADVALSSEEIEDGIGVDAVFVAIDHPEADTSRPFSQMLREVVGWKAVPVVLYGRAPLSRLSSLASQAEADGAIRIDTGVDEFIEAVGSVLHSLPRSRGAYNDS
jgi:hypothetical protein